MSAAVALVALASCSDDLEFNSPKDATAETAGVGEMIATIDGGALTRYGLNEAGTKLVWAQNDAYTVYDKQAVQAKVYTIDNAYAGSKAGKFATSDGTEIDPAQTRFAVYPFRPAADNPNYIKSVEDIDGSIHTLYVNIRDSYDYTEITSGANSDLGEEVGVVTPIPMFGLTNNRKVNFQFMTALMRVDLKGIPADYGNGKLIIDTKVAAEDQLSGEFKAVITDQMTGTSTTYPTLAGNETAGAVGADNKKITVNFATSGEDIDRVFYIPIPAGVKKENIRVGLFKEATTPDFTTYNADMDLSDLITYSGTAATTARNEAIQVKYVVHQDVSATSLKEVNKAVADFLAANKNDGRTVTFDITGDGTAVFTATTDNMILIPATTNNIILNFNDGLTITDDDLFVSEEKAGTAVLGEAASTNKNQWTSQITTSTDPASVTGYVEFDAVVAAAGASTRKVTINTNATTSSKNVYVYAPTASVSINTTETATATCSLSHIYAGTATANKSLSVGESGAQNLVPTPGITQYVGGLYYGIHAYTCAITHNGANDVDVVASVNGSVVDNGSGLLKIYSTSTVTNDVTNNAGDVTIDGSVTGSLTNAAAAGNIIVNGTVTTTVNQNSTSGTTTVNKGATIGTLTTAEAATGAVTVKAATITTINRNGTGNLTIQSDLTKAPADGEGSWALGNTVTDAQANACNANVSTINNYNTGNISVSSNMVALTIVNSNQAAQISVDAEIYYMKTATGNPLAQKSGTTNITITDPATFSTKSEGNISVSNSEGVVAITNYGGTTTLNKVVNANNTLTHNSRSTNRNVTLTDSYVKSLTYDPNIACQLTANGSSGIGEDLAATNALTITDNTGNSYDNVCAHNINGNIYTAAQLTALIKAATTEATITLLYDLPYTATEAAWTGIKQGSITKFDGNNKTISGLKLAEQDKSGLFGEVASNALEVKNLFLDNISYSASEVTGGFVGEKEGHEGVAALIGYASKEVTLNYVEVNNSNIANGNNTASSGTAALIGLAGGNVNFTFNYCEVKNTTLSGHYYLGGMIGILRTALTVSFKECAATPTFSVAGDQSTVAASNNFEATKSGTVGMYIGGATTTVNTLTIDANSEFGTLSGKAALGYNKNNKVVDNKTYYFTGGKDCIGFVQGTITTFNIASVAQIAYPTTNNTYNQYSATANN